MSKHSKHTKKNKDKLQQTIRIDDVEELKKIKSNRNKIPNEINIDNTNKKNTKNVKKNKKQKIKKPPSKLKKFILKFILIIFFITAITFGIWQSVEAYKWQGLAKQMCQNTNSIVVDLNRKYYCYSWLTANS